MNPYRVNDKRSKYITKNWWIPYNFTLYKNKESQGEIHWTKYWEQELNKYCQENDVYLVSHSVTTGISATNPTNNSSIEYYGVLISCVFLK